jgi:hypothetical protein
VVIGYFLFAFALGTAAGVIVRRTVVAMVVTVGGFLALRLPIEGYFRPNYMPPLTSRVDLAASKIQAIETAIFVGLALALMGIAAAWARWKIA